MSIIAGKIKGITITLGADVQPLNKALEDVNKKTRDVQSELRQVERLLKLDPSNTTLLAQKQKLLADAVANSREKLDRLKSAQEQVNEQFKRGEIGEEQYRAFQREVVRAEQDLERLEKQLADVNNKWKDAAEHLDKMGKKSVEVGKSLSTKVTAPIVGIGVAATKMGSDFVDALAKVSTLADTTQVSMDDLKKGILDISNVSGVAATEVSESVYSALSAGVETSEVLGFIESNIMLVKAGFTEMGTAIDVTTTVLNAYGDAAYDVTKIGDILVKTQDEGKISVDELGKNLGRVIPTASSLGVNLDQLGASYAIMTAKGQNANIATTNLNSMLGELGKTGSKADKALREMTDKSFKELVADGETVGDVLGLLSEYAEQAGLSLADMFGSTTAGSAALTLLSDGVEGFNESVDTMNNASGTMAENFEKLQTPSEELKIAINKIKNAMLDVAEATLPIMSKMAEAIGKVADKLLAMDEKTRNVVLVIAGLAAAIGPLLIVLGAMASGLSAIIGILPVLGTALTALTGPIGIAVAAVAGLIAIGVALYKNWDKIKAKAAEIWGVIRDTLVGILDAIKGFVEERWNAVATTTTTVWTTISDWLSALWERIKAQVTASWNAIYGTITGIWTRIKDGFDNLVKAAWDWGKNLLAEFIAGIKSKISALWDTLTNIAETVAGFLGFHSPTKLGPGRYADQWAPNFMRMFADGITKNLPLLEKALSRAVVVMQMSLAGGGSISNVTYNTGGNTINITVQDGEDLLRTLHRLGVRIP